MTRGICEVCGVVNPCFTCDPQCIGCENDDPMKYTLIEHDEDATDLINNMLCDLRDE